jgi:hypothetical protein
MCAAPTHACAHHLFLESTHVQTGPVTPAPNRRRCIRRVPAMYARPHLSRVQTQPHHRAEPVRVHTHDECAPYMYNTVVLGQVNDFIAEHNRLRSRLHR